jgi:2-oxoglutarate ferredoxin oxidoreductase subunit beta
MPSVATGANMANRDLLYIGVSGDGDTASIGMGQFVHAVRRNVNMVYICENNGVYGLTKGQDSATTDVGSKSKKGEPNALEPIDLCSIALQLGATFVANSFSGDKNQLVPIIQSAIAHKGFAFINVISPCVTFGNVPGSTKSYDYIRQHMASTNTVDYVPPAMEITTDYEEGTDEHVTMHDGSIINLHKLESKHDIHSRRSALELMQNYKAEDKIVTGILFIDSEAHEIHDTMNTTAVPLRNLSEKTLCPGASRLEEINTLHR